MLNGQLKPGYFEEKIRNWFGGLADEILQDNRIDCAQGITADTFAAA